MMAKKLKIIEHWLAECRANGLSPTVGPMTKLPEIAPQTANTEICGLPTEDSVVVGVPPSVNNLFRAGGAGDGGRRFTTKEYKKWTAANGYKLAALGRITEYPVGVRLTVECKMRVGRDLDNLCKAILDTMVKVGVLEGDDWRYVSRVVVEHRLTDKGDGMRVRIVET